MIPNEFNTKHIPILLGPIVEALVAPFVGLSEAHWLVDCTLGGGGHTRAFLGFFDSKAELRHHKILGVDRDPAVIQRSQSTFQREIAEGRLFLHNGRFGELAQKLKELPVMGLMADLGFSSDQLDDPQRGLSFLSDGPLDMRLDPSQGRTCEQLLREISVQELEEVLRDYGEERFAQRIAGSIIAHRAQGKLPKTTRELSEIVIRAIPKPARHGRIHAATRTFQALRVAVNEELSELDALLEEVIPNVKVGGRVAILSFHSLEDRRVKTRLKHRPDFQSLTKKPIQADDEEIRTNSRARSAKLRVAEKVAEENNPC